MFSGEIHDILECRQRNRDVIFIGFAFFRHGFGDSFTECPERRELCWILRKDPSVDKGFVGGEQVFKEIVEFLCVGRL